MFSKRFVPNASSHIVAHMPKPIVILGCTASGKSDLAEAIAAHLGVGFGADGTPRGGLMAVDSMQVYRRMDIGTAKPSAEARGRFPYLMLDLAEPWESFSAAKFVETARPILERSKVMNSGSEHPESPIILV